MPDKPDSKIQDQPDYELHMPGFLTHPVQVGIISFIIGAFVYAILREKPIWGLTFWGICVVVGGLYASISSSVKKFTNLESRLKARDKFLSEIPFRGDETVLDVGCGNGILILSAAKHLTTGKGIGIDIWTEGAGDSHPRAFHRNAEIEGVADRVSLQNEDVRKLPYEDESIDIIISGLTMHHILHGSGTDKAVSEMVRVLKPGGCLAIYDVRIAVNTSAKLMLKNGLEIEKKYQEMVFGLKPV